MKRNARNASDTTGDTAVGDVSGDSLLVEVLSRIEDEQDRVLVLAHKGLDISLRNLSRALGISSTDLSRRIDATIERLREDRELIAMLGEIRWAGRIEHYQALAFRLGLQDWFCSYCGQFMVQSELGVMRKTCSDRCRAKLHRTRGVVWKDQYRDRLTKGSQSAPDLGQTARDVDTWSESLLKVIEPINGGHRRMYWWQPKTFWWQAETQSRDRAIVLLGFTCPIPLSSSDLAALDVDDVIKTADGLEVRLYRRDKRATRYVNIPVNVDSRLCTVTAISDWRGRMVRSGRTTGPLFIRIDPAGHLPIETVRLTSWAITGVIAKAINSSNGPYSHTQPAPSTPLPEFLNQIRWQQH